MGEVNKKVKNIPKEDIDKEEIDNEEVSEEVSEEVTENKIDEKKVVNKKEVNNAYMNKKKKIIIIGSLAIGLFVLGIIVFLIIRGLNNSVDEYTITLNNGTGVEEVKCKKNTMYNLEELTKENYIFLGWYNDTEKVLKVFCDKDYNLVARFEKDDKTSFTITFNSNGGTLVEPITVNRDEKLELPDDPTKEGFKFVGWFDQDDTPITNGMVLENKDITLYAKWEEQETVKVTFDTDGGNYIDPANVVKGEVLTPPKNPTKKGYEFVEWQLDGVKYDFNTKVDKEITLKATWVKAKAKFVITFNSMGGSKVDSITLTEGDKFTEPKAPTKSGYLFHGWYDQNDMPISTGALLAAEDVTLYAKWEKAIVITFDSKGGSKVNSITMVEGDPIVMPKEPTKSGYKFGGWFDQDDKAINGGEMLDKSMTLYAKWLKTFTITFDSNGGTKVNSITLADGDKFTPPKNPTKDGFTFGGWYDKNDMPIGEGALLAPENITLTAKWNAVTE